MQVLRTEDTLTPDQLEALRAYDTCSLANAIERFEVRLRNEGYTGAGLRCVFGDFPPVLGYAYTSRIRSSDPPMSGSGYEQRTDWWERFEQGPSPRIAVIEDIDRRPGAGAVAGEVHCAILQRLGCVALVTNGAVRDLGPVREMGFAMFAGGVTVGHAYYHAVDFDARVRIFGLDINPGDLLCGDCHGLLSIPKGIAAGLPAAAEELRRHERKVVDLCRSPEFSIEKLRAAVQDLR